MKAPEILVPPEGRVLCIAPHPDDESCGPGGSLALHLARGDQVHVVFVTDGSNGDPEQRFGSNLVEVREQEALAACQVLGGASHEFYRLPDNYVATASDLAMVAERLRASIEAFGPRTIYVPWPGEAHQDHANCYAALALLFGDDSEFSGEDAPRIFEYEVWSPLPADWIVDISDFAETKRQAIRAHVSQLAYTDYPHQLLGLAAHRSVYLPKPARYGEAFREAALHRGRRS
ncbi:MAG: hypothetical protein CSA62_12035 [Planctomycetota bacterium]|nr:MAG: hypothetical protein CSA62_12035 [Planctomycetota bacterium]